MFNLRLAASAAALGLCLAATAAAEEPSAAPEPAAAPAAPVLTLPELPGFASDKEKISYMIGLQMSRNLVPVAEYVDPAALARAIEAGLSGKDLKMSDEQAMAVAQAFGQFMQAKELAKRAEQAARNLAEGDAFLAGNKNKPGVRSTESGLQYQVVRAGSGAQPTAADTVKVHYRGMLLDGTEFDSSYARNEPMEFPLASVIPGWTEGVQLMKVGAKYTFWIPAALGYGENGAGASIPPNATLKFEVELLDVVKAPAAAPAAP